MKKKLIAFLLIVQTLLSSMAFAAEKDIPRIYGEISDNGIDIAVRVAPTLPQIEQILSTQTVLIQTPNRNLWKSPEGLVYGPDYIFGNRALHVLSHTHQDPTKPQHSVFINANKDWVFNLVDEGWRTKGAPLPNNPGAYVVNMNRRIGTLGEYKLMIIVRPGTNKIITAYPRF